MTIKPRADLPKPPDDLHLLADHERVIGGGPVYSLADVKAYIKGNGIDVFNLATQKASNDLLSELRWRLTDLAGFFSCLEKHHYRRSQWVYGSGKAKIAFPADVYMMGYNRIKVQEWDKVDPWNYLKFSFSLENKTIEIFSIHPENC